MSIDFVNNKKLVYISYVDAVKGQCNFGVIVWDDFCTYLWVRFFNLRDLCRTIFRYWWKPKFALADCSLLLGYFFKSPYRIGREFNAHEPYGETPLVTLKAIVKACPIAPDGVAYELGSGRGRCCFWLSEYLGVKTVGIENNPVFVERAQAIAQRFHLDKVAFRLEDIVKADFHEATWIYLFGTALTDEVIRKLGKRLRQLKKGTKIITISYPLTEYVQGGILLLKEMDVDFAWGTTQAYIHEVV